MSHTHTGAEASVRPQVDWPALRRRLEHARINLEGTAAVAPDSQRAILRARARAVAIPARVVEQEATLAIVECVVAYERYAMELCYVREIAPLRNFSPLPAAPRFVVGIMNLRGRILSVVDLKRFFDLPDRGLTDLNKVIVLQHGAMEFGVVVDAVVGVRSLKTSALQPSLPTLTGIRAEFSRGVTSEPLVLLDAQRILSDQRLVPSDTPSAI